MKKYLDLQGDFTLRRNITKLRISSHQLEIERGRYCSKKGSKNVSKRKRGYAKIAALVKQKTRSMLL